jgi:hypothetical protein
LACYNPIRRTNTARDAGNQAGQSGGVLRASARQHLKGHHNQGVPGQKRQGYAKFRMNGRFAAAKVSIIKAGQIVVDQRCAMKKLNRGRSGIGQIRI